MDLKALYGPFFVSVGLLFWAYISGLILFAGAQFSAIPKADKPAEIRSPIKFLNGCILLATRLRPLMDLRFSTSAALSLVFFLSPLYSQTAALPQSSETNWYATVQVQVRDSNGHPVSALEPANFVITENGTTDPIVSVQSFQELASAAAAPPPEIPNQEPSPNPALAQSASPATGSARPTTWVLIILAPMSATGRNASITGIQKFLNLPHPADWSFALFDDGCQLTPFSKDLDAIRFRLSTLAHHLSKPQFIGGPWVPLPTAPSQS